MQDLSMNKIMLRYISWPKPNRKQQMYWIYFLKLSIKHSWKLRLCIISWTTDINSQSLFPYKYHSTSILFSSQFIFCTQTIVMFLIKQKWKMSEPLVFQNCLQADINLWNLNWFSCLHGCFEHCAKDGFQKRQQRTAIIPAKCTDCRPASICNDMHNCNSTQICLPFHKCIFLKTEIPSSLFCGGYRWLERCYSITLCENIYLSWWLIFLIIAL